MNQRVFESMVIYAQKELSLLKQRRNIGQLIKFRQRIFFSNEHYYFQMEPVIHTDEIRGDRGSEELSNVISLMVAEKIIPQNHPHSEYFINTIIAAYINENLTLDFDSNAFKAIYQKYELNATRDYVSCSLTIPLLGFTSETDKIEFDNDITIERFADEDKNDLDLNFSFTGIEDIAKCQYKINKVIKIKSSSTAGIPEEFVRSGLDCITALRLLHAGKVGTNECIARMPRSEVTVLTLSHGASRKINDFGLPTIGNNLLLYMLQPYKLMNSEIDSFKILYYMVSNSTVNKYLEIAFKWFNKSYLSEDNLSSSDDRVLYLTIALESCLLYEERLELSYKFALRGATVLRTIRDPNETFNQLRKLYDIRSKVVHDGKSLKNMNINEGFLQNIESIAREILTEYINRISLNLGINKNHLKRIKEDLDREAINCLLSK